MCLLCLEIAKKRITMAEARRALNEMVRTTSDQEAKQHYEELENATDDELQQKAVEFDQAQKGR